MELYRVGTANPAHIDTHVLNEQVYAKVAPAVREKLATIGGAERFQFTVQETLEVEGRSLDVMRYANTLAIVSHSRTAEERAPFLESLVLAHFAAKAAEEKAQTAAAYREQFDSVLANTAWIASESGSTLLPKDETVLKGLAQAVKVEGILRALLVIP
ncbi:MAG: hypothetical protein ACT4TC_00900 [Myxococcaceae bacterium]